MARVFASASSQYLTAASAPATAAPLTIAAWLYQVDDPGSLQSVASIQITSGYDNFSLLVRAPSAADQNYFFANASTSAADSAAQTSTFFARNVWAHGAAVFASSTSRTAYLNGGNTGTNTDSRVPSGVDRCGIGRVGNSFGTNYLGGRVAEVGIWNVALTAADITALAAGMCPLMVKPTSLISYWPLIGQYSPEIDLKGKVDLTLTNTPTTAAHPRIIYPSGPVRITTKAAAAPAGDAVPVCWAQYRARAVA